MTFVLRIVAPKQPANTVDFAPFFTHTIFVFILGVGDFNKNLTYQDKLKTFAVFAIILCPDCFMVHLYFAFLSLSSSYIRTALK